MEGSIDVETVGETASKTADKLTLDSASSCETRPETSTSISKKPHKLSSTTVKSKTKPSSSKQKQTTSCPEEKKNKLRTSKDVYDRLKWSAVSTNIDVSSLYVGYRDRFLGMCELPFEDFIPGGDIPFHRVYYFRSGGAPICPHIGEDGEVQVREDNWPEGSVLQWDRESRIDLVFNSGETIVATGKSRAKSLQADKKGNGGGSSKSSGSDSESNGAEKKESIKKPAASSESATELDKDTVLLCTPKNYSVIPVYKYNSTSQSWEINNNSSCGSVSHVHLNVVTFNVLYELVRPEILHSAKRWPYLIDLLENYQADIIALQEVTPPFLSLLQSQPWVQKEYFLTDIVRKSLTIKPYGQILLTKISPHTVFFCGKSNKRFMFASFFLNERILHIPVVHLTSDYRSDNRDTRRKQINDIISSCTVASETAPHVPTDIIIVGDSNFVDDESIESADLDTDWEFVDVWSRLLGPDPGFTFNVEKNPLAKQLTRHCQSRRFDRIFVNSENTFQPTKIRLLGEELIDFYTLPRCISASVTHIQKLSVIELSPERIEPLSVSDHYGLQCEFELSPPTQNIIPDSHNLERGEHGLPVFTSAVVVIPPEEIWLGIQKVRSEFDSNFHRWMPHINLLFGFIPDLGTNFSEASQVFSKALKNFDPFHCKLSELAVFNHEKSSTAYLAPASPGNEKLKQLKNILLSEYPHCDDTSKKSPDGFTPHLTIAKLSLEEEKAGKINKLLKKWGNEFGSQWNKEFLVDRIYIISRVDSSPFCIKNTILFQRLSQEEKS